jgi:hypothetical protein
MLGLFNVAPDIKIKSKSEVAEDNQLLNQAKDFFNFEEQ